MATPYTSDIQLVGTFLTSHIVTKSLLCLYLVKYIFYKIKW